MCKFLNLYDRLLIMHVPIQTSVTKTITPRFEVPFTGMVTAVGTGRTLTDVRRRHPMPATNVFEVSSVNVHSVYICYQRETQLQPANPPMKLNCPLVLI